MHDLRAFLQHLSRHRQLLEIDAPVDPELESTSLCLRALREGGPALLMHNPTGSAHPLLGNLFGHRRRIELRDPIETGVLQHARHGRLR